jgi:hypothetical protein
MEPQDQGWSSERVSAREFGYFAAPLQMISHPNSYALSLDCTSPPNLRLPAEAQAQNQSNHGTHVARTPRPGSQPARALLRLRECPFTLSSGNEMRIYTRPRHRIVAWNPNDNSRLVDRCDLIQSGNLPSNYHCAFARIVFLQWPRPRSHDCQIPRTLRAYDHSAAARNSIS